MFLLPTVLVSHEDSCQVECLMDARFQDKDNTRLTKQNHTIKGSFVKFACMKCPVSHPVENEVEGIHLLLHTPNET